MTQPYRVRLEEFEGPLDLLLFFIKRDELDIEDIPIARITREFLDALHLMQQLDLEVAGEFIVMAAELMQIKVRMLLPREEGEEEETDPRAELVRRLVEYKRFKEKSLEMSSMEDEQRRLYYRRFFTGDPVTRLDDGEDEGMKEITLFNLITAFRRAMDQMPRKVIHEVQMPNVSVDEQMSFTLDYLRVHGSARLLAMVSHMTEKIRVIVTIIALLEMAKNRVITLAPADGGEDILIESTGSAAVVIPATPR